MRTIILSPHLDDGAYSCGGWIWEARRKGEEVINCTIFAASPDTSKIPPFAELLQILWNLPGDAVAGRRAEDISACHFMGCAWCHLEFMDCIYRFLPENGQPLINELDELSSPIHEMEHALVNQITTRLKELFPNDKHFFAPLGVGGHVDHRITRAVAERLGEEITYYLDYPYAAKDVAYLNQHLPAGAMTKKYLLSEEGLTAWQRAISLYPSQIDSFWSSNEEMQDQLKSYASSPLGSCFWKISP